MKISILFPTNRGTLLRALREGLVPDTLLFGTNHLSEHFDVDFLSVNSHIEEALNRIAVPLTWIFGSKFTRLNLGRALLALPDLRRSGMIITCVDSMSKAVLLLKKIHLLNHPVICMAGNVMDGTERLPRAHRWLWSSASRITTHAQVDQEKLEHLKLGDLGTMIPVGSDTTFYKASVKKPQRNLIAAIGSDRDRDYETLIRVARRLPNFKFEIHLSNDQLRYLSKPSNVKFSLDATPTSSRDLLRRAEIVVIPLKETLRAAGQLALTDALLMEKPVIISSTRGVVEPYRLKHKNTVFLVRPRSVDSLLKGIGELHRDSKMRYWIGSNGRQLALRYTTRKYAKKLRQVINNVFA